ncbi:MAG: biopolymer transporter ExbD [Candidatus Acidiferrales bacterium]|jgi:biopolymer transport protein TolR
MGMAVGGNKGSMSEPNIVPLIDVLLVLIIIFMVITPTTPQGLDALVPQPTPPNQQENKELLDKTIVVQVTADGKVMINQDSISWDDLGPRLEDIFKQRAEKVAFVKGDDNVEFANVARAIDIMRGAGIDNVGLITAKIEAGQ